MSRSLDVATALGGTSHIAGLPAIPKREALQLSANLVNGAGYENDYRQAAAAACSSGALIPAVAVRFTGGARTRRAFAIDRTSDRRGGHWRGGVWRARIPGSAPLM